MDRNKRRLVSIALVAAFAASGCSGAGAVPPGTSPSVMSAFPSRAEYGVAAQYRVYAARVERGPVQLVALQVQTPQSYLSALEAVPVPYARVRYPDGSVQRAAADAGFDSAASTYARGRRHVEGTVSVLLSATVAGVPLTAGTHVTVLSAAEEAATASGAMADDSTMQLRPAYAFTCDPSHYMRPAVIDVAAGKAWDSPRYKAQADISYYPLVGYCGVDNSFLPPSFATAVRYWSDTENITVTKGSVLGCIQSSGHPLARPSASEFACTVRTWYANVTFYASKPWASNPDVALWFEAWHSNFLRIHDLDAHLALLRVR
jgi:hypothetical protein